MISPEAWKPFFEYLDPDKKDLSWEDRGLIPSAPIKVVKAYRKSLY